MEKSKYIWHLVRQTLGILILIYFSFMWLNVLSINPLPFMVIAMVGCIVVQIVRLSKYDSKLVVNPPTQNSPQQNNATLSTSHSIPETQTGKKTHKGRLLILIVILFAVLIGSNALNAGGDVGYALGVLIMASPILVLICAIFLAFSWVFGRKDSK